MKETKPTPADVLAEKMKARLPEDYEASPCMMVNMADPYGEAPERVMITPKREVYRAHRLAKTTVTVLRKQVRELCLKLKAEGGDWATITMDGYTIYLQPK